MKTIEIVRRLDESLIQLAGMLSDEYSENRLPPRNPLNPPENTCRSLPTLSLEDLFEAELGRAYYGRSLLRDQVTHQPLEVEDILQALGYHPDVVTNVLAFIRRVLDPTFAVVAHEGGPSPLVMFWFQHPAVLNLRVIIHHDDDIHLVGNPVSRSA